MVFSKLLSRHFPIEVFGNNDAENFIKWGTDYSSYNPNDDEYPEIVIHLPTNPINIKQYWMKSRDTDIFPSKWSLYGSFDNTNWETLSEKDEYLCTNHYVFSQTQPIEKIFCNGSQIKHYPVNSKAYFHYIKFKLRETTYLVPSSQDLFCFHCNL